MSRVRPLLAAAFLLVAATGQPVAQSGEATQLVYADSLVNGWWRLGSAAVDLAIAAPVHGGSRSIGVTLTAFQDLTLRHAPLTTRIYSSLRFWVHGGSRGGQRLRVRANINGVPQPAVTLAPLVADTWQQVTLSMASLGIEGKADVTAILIGDVTGTTQPVFYIDDISLTILPPPATVRLAVDAGQVVRTANARHFGVNTAVWDPVLDSATTISLLMENGNQALRFPGGGLADEYHWDSNTKVPRGTCIGALSQATSFDQFAHVATTTEAQVFIITNYGSGTPAEAADWVRYSNLERFYGFKYWEVGNENFLDFKTDCTARAHDPFIYATRFKDYFSQMKAVDPTIKVGAAVVLGEDRFASYTDHPATNPRTGQVHNGWTPVMLATLKSLGVTPDFVSYHRYPQEAGFESDADLLQSSAEWTSDAADLRQQLVDYLGAAAANVELLCTENNSVAGDPGKQTTSLVNALFMADSVGQVLQTEFNSHLWWDLREDRATTNNNASWLYGWRQYGDYGLLSVEASNRAGPFERLPTYYATKLLRQFARGGDRIVRATSDYPLLSVYAAKRTDGALTLLVVNKSPGNTLNAAIALTGYTPASSAVTYQYGRREDDAARTGASTDVAETRLSGAAPNFAYSFPPYSVTVLVLAAGQ